MTKTCEFCGNPHEGEFGSGRFCSKTCSCAFSTKAKRDEINRKVSATLSGQPSPTKGRTKGPTPEDVRQKISDGVKKNTTRRHTRESLLAVTFIKNGRRFKRQHVALFKDLDLCEECGQTSIWNGKPLVLHIDHINGDDSDHRLENLRILCPNCHTQTHTWGYKGARKKGQVV